MSDALMKFDPATGWRQPYPSQASQWRGWHGDVAWLFNPWTGERRNAADVGSDPFGLLIIAAGEEVQAQPAADALEAAREDAEDAARYRWLRKGESDDVVVVRGLGSLDYGMSAVVSTYSEEIDGDDLDAAIDQARKKENKNVQG